MSKYDVLFKDATCKLGEAMRQWFGAPGDCISEIAGYAYDAMDAIKDAVSVSIEKIELDDAEAYCREMHPDWVLIYRRTKKKRIRKKYRDRMIRTYRADKEAGNEKENR